MNREEMVRRSQMTGYPGSIVSSLRGALVAALWELREINDALGTDETGDALVEIARKAHEAEQQYAEATKEATYVSTYVRRQTPVLAIQFFPGVEVPDNLPQPFSATRACDYKPTWNVNLSIDDGPQHARTNERRCLVNGYWIVKDPFRNRGYALVLSDIEFNKAYHHQDSEPVTKA